MAERRTAERRTKGQEFRADVQKVEFDRLQSLVTELSERVADLQSEVEDLHVKVRILSGRKAGV